MNVDKNTGNWHAIFVRTGKESDVKQRLLFRFGNELRFIVPKRKIRERKNGIWRDSIKVLFPGYILVNGYLTPQHFHQFSDIPGLLCLLHANKQILQIPNEEIEILARLTGDSELIDISEIFIENDVIQVIDGPLTALEGIITKIDARKGRAKVLLNFLGEQRTVDLGISIIQKR